MIAPTEVPEINFIGILCSSSALRTPIWAIPLAAPPLNAKPVLSMILKLIVKLESNHYLALG